MKASPGLVLTAVVSAAFLLGACSTSPSYGPRYVEVVRVAPPPQQFEVVGSPPMVGHVWISGYWNWGGARYVWVPGRWEAPRHGHRWVPHRWERDGDHWRQHGGHWERSSHAETARPPLAHDRPSHGASRGDSHDRHERRDWGRRPEPHVEHREVGRPDRMDGLDRARRHEVERHRDHSAPVVASREVAPRAVPESPRGHASPAEPRRDNRGENRGRGRNGNDERRERERGRGRDGN